MASYCNYCKTELFSKYSKKYCSVECGRKAATAVAQTKAEQKRLAAHAAYDADPTPCKQCGTALTYDQNAEGYKFCNRSCGQTFVNANRTDEEAAQRIEKLRATYDKKFGIVDRPILASGRRAKHKYTGTPHEFECVICGTTGKSRTAGRKCCSKDCVSEHNRRAMNERIAQGYNPQKHRGRGKVSYLEKSFREWLAVEYPNEPVEIEYSLRIDDENGNYLKTYFLDFYFPTRGVCVELDGSQHKKAADYDAARDAFVREAGIETIRISHAEYRKGSKIDLVRRIFVDAI